MTCSKNSAPESDKRERILNSAIKVLARKGYQYATIAEIAAVAGVAKGLVHVYFQSKLDILLDVILLFMGSVNDLIAAKLAVLDCPVKRLHSVFEAFMELMSRSNKDLCWGQILKEGLPSTDTLKDERIREKYALIGEQGKRLQETLDRIIADGQQQGLIDSSLKPEVIRQMLGGANQLLYHGLSLESHGRAHIGYDEADAQKGIAALIDKFVIKK